MKSRSAGRGAGGSISWLTALVLAVGVAGCNGPIEGYRSLAGYNKNDPDPATVPFTENLESSEHSGYPNLASVPPPPIVSTTAEERAKIAEALNEQRASVQAPDTQGHPGSPTPGPVPPPPPIPPALASNGVPAAPPQPPPQMRQVDEPPEPGPLQSTLEAPKISAPPPGLEATRVAPAQGAMPAMPQPVPSQLPPATVQSANPQPSPPPASLPAPQLSPQAAALPPPKLPPTPVTVASLDLTPGSSGISADERAHLAEIVAQYQQKPGIVRVVAYAAAATGSAEQLNSFRAALDRAQMVAKELSEAGIPAKQLQTEAAPSSPRAPTGRVEIQLLPPAPGASG
jgi:hypothetical protein